MPVEEIFVSDEGEVGVDRVMVAVVSHQGIEGSAVRLSKLNIETRQHRRYVHEISVMKVMVTVPSRTEVCKLIT